MQINFDLSAFSADHHNDRRFSEVCKRVRTLGTLASVIIDLETSISALHEVANVVAATMAESPEAGAQDDGLGLMGQALFNSALIHYCRATHSAAIDRGAFSVINNFDAVRRAHHKRITSLRDRVIAHFGKGGDEVGAVWVDERVVLTVEHDSVRIQEVWRRHNYRGEDTVLLLGLAETALEMARERRDTSRGRLAEELDRLIATEPHFERVLAKYEFDPSTFFEDSGHVVLAAPGYKATTHAVTAGFKLGPRTSDVGD